MIHERHIPVARSARYYLLGENGPQVDDVWFVCHGYGQLAGDFIREFECIAAPNRLVVAPEALSRYYISTAPGFHSAEAKVGATWMTREDRDVEIADYVAYLDTLYAEILDGLEMPAKVTVLGFSQGGTTASRWLMRGSTRASRLVLWGSLLAGDADLAEAAKLFRDVELSIVYGTRDQLANAEMIADYENVLRNHSIRYRLAAFEGGHRMDRDTLKDLADGSI
jgi:predicted esterase